MNTIVSSRFILLLSLVFNSVAVHAIPQDCTELEAQYQSDAISYHSDDCDDANCETINYKQLRTAGQKTDPKYNPNWTDEEVYKRYGPAFNELKIANETFDAVAFCVGSVCPTLFFEQGTTQLINLSRTSDLNVDDSDVTLIGGQVCATPLMPLDTTARRTKLCELSVNRLKIIAPDLKITLPFCLGPDSKFALMTNAREPGFADFGVISENAATGDIPFMCTAKLNRSNETMNNLNCFTWD